MFRAWTHRAGSLHVALAWAVAIGIPSVGWPHTARAEPAPARPEEALARDHFEQALTLYRAGRYRKALAELERAAALDPSGKDLFFNMALVHEKLGQLEQAITALERFRELEPDPAERERAEGTIVRLRGAAEERRTEAAMVSARSAPCREAPESGAAELVPPETEPAPSRGRVVGPVVIGAGTVAAVAAVLGTVFGLRALRDDPDGETTSAGSSIGTLRERGDRASREALVADISFAIAAAAAGTAFTVYWMSDGAEAPRRAAVSYRVRF